MNAPRRTAGPPNPFDIVDWPNRVVFEPGGVARLEAIVGQLGVGRAMVVCGPTVAGGEMLERVTAGLGPACAGVFAEIEPQNPLPCVRAGAEAAAAAGAEVLVSVGGGSAIDAAKCIALLRASGGELAPYAIDYGESGWQRRELGDGVLPHIAVPTTAGSASEVMPTVGCRDPEARRKLLFWDRKLVPDVVVLDPEMAVFAGPELTAATGMTAMARCVEALYSAARHPISTALALHGARLLMSSLARSVVEPDNLAARADCQLGCLMSGTASINAMVSVVHAVGHIVGGRYGLQHGIAHAILLAPAMRMLLPAIGDGQHRVLEALGGRETGMTADAAGETAADAIQDLLAALPLERRLRDVGIAEGDLAGIATATMDDYMMATVPRQLGEGEVKSLLKSVW